VNIDHFWKIVRVFHRDIALEVTIRELSKRAKLSYNATYRTIQELVKQDFFLLKKFGQASAVSLNKNNRKIIPILSFAAYQHAEEELSKPQWEETKQFIDSLTIREAISLVIAPEKHPQVLIIADNPVLEFIKQHHPDLEKHCTFMNFDAYKKMHQKNHLLIKGAEQLYGALVT